MKSIILFFQMLFKRHKKEPAIKEHVAESAPVQLPEKGRPHDLPASNHYDGWNEAKIRQEYEYLFSICKILPEWQRLTDKYVAKYKANKDRYESISKLTGVPAKIIAVIHMKESSMDFNDHLHNGDPLTKRTTRVPAGRPKAPPKNGKYYTFEESAIDALQYDGLTKVKDWSIGNSLMWLERYNGRGYRTGAGRATNPRNASPYTFSGTPFYVSGQYVSDGKFSATAKAKNLGCMAFLKQLEIEGI